MIGSVTGPMGDTYSEEAPRLSEIVRMLSNMDRKFDDFKHQVQTQLNDKVSKERYEPERERINDRILALETRIIAEMATVASRFTEVNNKTRAISNAFYGGLASLVVGGILLWIGSK